MSLFPRLVAALAACVVLCSASGAFADDDAQTAEARRLYAEAKKLMGDKKYSEAALSFEAAGRLKTNAVALYTAAQAWELAREPGRAADAYALALVTPKLNEAQKQKSEERLAELRKDLGTASVSGDDGTRVRLDDHMELAVPTKLHGIPGEHTLAIVRSDGTSDSRKLKLEAGKTVEVDADERPETKPDKPKVKRVELAETRKAPVEEKKSTGPSPLKTLGFVGIGAGVAALGGAVLLGLSAKDAEDTYKSRPSRETLDHAEGLESKTNIMLIAGGVLTAVGVTLVVWPSKKQEKAPDQAALTLRVGPASVLAGGQF
ncbi:MAG: hypothetical protein IPI67_09315 [Myxococcales bacterium]|nr:hypothetical protein [Myxococcales bacterium]